MAWRNQSKNRKQGSFHFHYSLLAGQADQLRLNVLPFESTFLPKKVSLKVIFLYFIPSPMSFIAVVCFVEVQIDN